MNTQIISNLVNTSARYGDPVAVTIEDYQELNPEGRFEIDYNGNIREVFSDTPGDFEIVAKPIETDEE